MVFEAPGAEMESVLGGLAGVAAAVQSVIEPGGTLVVPTCTATEGYPKPPFDPALSPSEVGPFSEFFRKQPGVVRSHNATHSVAARGVLADKLVAGHREAAGRPTPWGESPFGKGSPWNLLYEQNAWWVMVCARWESSPFLSYVQALYAERHAMITKRTPFPQFNGEALGRDLEDLGILRKAQYGSCQMVGFRLREAVDAALKMLEENPSRLEPHEDFKRWLRKVDRINRHGYLRVGRAKAVISPPVPCARWDGKRLMGIYRDLFARVLLLSSGEQSVVLVLCDLLGIARQIVNRIREQVTERTGLPAEAIMVACTHSHSTPNTVDTLTEVPPQYLERLVNAVVDAVCRAARDMQPGRLGWGRVPIRGIARSRRFEMADGRVFTTRYYVPSTWRVNPDLIVGEGPVDPDLTVLRIEDLDGEVMAVLSNFGCHASVALASPNVSGDYLGEAMAALEGLLGEQTAVLCTNGTAADVDPTLEMPPWGPRNDAMARHIGRLFAAQVLESLERIEVSDEVVIGASCECVDLPVRQDWVHLVQEEREWLEQEFASLGPQNATINKAINEGVIHTEVQALHLNDLTLVGFPGEVFTDTGLRLESEMAGGKVCVIELANDYIGYIVTPEAYAKGGYEVGPHLFTQVGPEAEETLLAAARRTVQMARRSGGFRDEGSFDANE
jgi:aminoglycoside N3'-acetyltransferase